MHKDASRGMVFGASTMKRLFALTLYALIAINCSNRNTYPISSMGSTMNFDADTQAQLDQGNQRINAFKDELLRQGFRQVSSSTLHSSEGSAREEVILEGQHGRLKKLRITLVTNTGLQKEGPELAGGVFASISDEQTRQEYEDLYKKVSAIVTGNP